jgi:sRNA-binding carbon storage regulator CsrA
MLVLNRRPGESIVIEPDVTVTVLSIADRRVWLRLESPGLPPVRISASALSPTEGRLEIGPLAAVAFDGGDVQVTTGGDDHPATTAQATVAVNRLVGEHVLVGSGLRVGLASLSKGNPCISFGGRSIGGEVRITLIRPAGSYVRLGVDAPDRRVYRSELWEVVQAGQQAAGTPGDPAPMGLASAPT